MDHSPPNPLPHKPNGNAFASSWAKRSSPTRSYVSAAVLGLFSSSCCVVQLLLNAFSIGCAGFSILTPLRPVFAAFSLVVVAYTLLKYGFSSRTALTLTIILTLTASPEIVSLYNQSPPDSIFAHRSLDRLYHNSNRVSNQLGWSQHRQDSSVLDPSTHSTHPISVSFIKYEVEVDGMACEACANRLRQHFVAQPGIEHVKVFFAAKKLEIWTRFDASLVMLSESAIQGMLRDVDSKYSAKLMMVYSAADLDK
ncbi:hypothetical protein EDD21DRAFT_242654 [Dissophora ornata]|nr:hypothetical protein EDD21DRAFT_242654 [Dissophora ornata]